MVKNTVSAFESLVADFTPLKHPPFSVVSNNNVGRFSFFPLLHEIANAVKAAMAKNFVLFMCIYVIQSFL